MTHKIEEWNDIKNNFISNDSSILLGNGASVAINEKFKYKSLKESSDINNNTTISKIFTLFNTEDFEFILRMLYYAYNINKTLANEDTKTTKAYEFIRKNLIDTIRDIHPSCPGDHQKDIDNIGRFLKNFKNVISLNYDLLIYWAMMKGNDDEDQAFMDFFSGGTFADDWESWSQKKTNSTFVFYPHGNLSLYRTKNNDEGKITKTADKTLLDTILNKWTTQNYIPLFVSEGTSNQKVKSIYSSNYLQTVFDSIIPRLKNNLVVYGWAFGKHDKHILKALAKSDINQIAVSVYRQNPNDDKKFCSDVSHSINNTFSKEVPVEFFDASSNDCWNKKPK